MHITKIQLQNIKCFDSIECSFENIEGASLVIAGDNGDGKSTILRSIALSLCDQWTAAGLLRELSGEFIKSGQNIDYGTIRLHLDNGSSKYIIKTIIKWNKDETYEYPLRVIKEFNTRGKSKQIEDHKFPWKDIFATGYGAGLRTSGTQDFQDYFTGDSIYSLFRDDVSLQNPELALRRITSSVKNKQGIKKRNEATNKEKVRDEILSWLKDILLLEDQKLELMPNGIYITKGDSKTPLAASGDGYKALTALVLDMLAWWFLNQFYDSEKGGLKKGKNVTVRNIKQISGIVIIDELEQHLHPKWQKAILPLLRDKFPRVQFIVATHSPLVISGSRNKVLILNNHDSFTSELFGWEAEEIYKEMGIKGSSRSREMEDLLDEFDKLYVKLLKGSLTNRGKRLLSNLEEKIVSGLPEADPAVQIIKLMNVSKELEPNAQRNPNRKTKNSRA